MVYIIKVSKHFFYDEISNKSIIQNYNNSISEEAENFLQQEKMKDITASNKTYNSINKTANFKKNTESNNINDLNMCNSARNNKLSDKVK